MDKLEIIAHLLFLGAIAVVIGLGSFWSIKLAYQVMDFVV